MPSTVPVVWSPIWENTSHILIVNSWLLRVSASAVIQHCLKLVIYWTKYFLVFDPILIKVHIVRSFNDPPAVQHFAFLWSLVIRVFNRQVCCNVLSDLLWALDPFQSEVRWLFDWHFPCWLLWRLHADFGLHPTPIRRAGALTASVSHIRSLWIIRSDLVWHLRIHSNLNFSFVKSIRGPTNCTTS